MASPLLRSYPKPHCPFSSQKNTTEHMGFEQTSEVEHKDMPIGNTQNFSLLSMSPYLCLSLTHIHSAHIIYSSQLESHKQFYSSITTSAITKEMKIAPSSKLLVGKQTRQLGLLWFIWSRKKLSRATVVCLRLDVEG